MRALVLLLLAGCAAPGPGPEARLRELGLELPAVAQPTGALIVPCGRSGTLLFVSGHLPVGPDGKVLAGRLGQDLDLKQGQAAARNVALRVLSVVKAELGSLDRVERVVKTLGMVACTPDFTQTPAVINGFSEVLIQAFGKEAGTGARSAVGMAALPAGACVEVEVVLQIR
jgi:enamine deaminase RidA (YjgF/YER057c/UK114 family)